MQLQVLVGQPLFAWLIPLITVSSVSMCLDISFFVPEKLVVPLIRINFKKRSCRVFVWIRYCCQELSFPLAAEACEILLRRQSRSIYILVSWSCFSIEAKVDVKELVKWDTKPFITANFVKHREYFRLKGPINSYTLDFVNCPQNSSLTILSVKHIIYFTI